MIKQICTLLILCVCLFAKAQDVPPRDSAWKVGGDVAFTFFNSNFVNRTEGGVPTTAINGVANAFANYKRNKWSWNNSLLLQYGIQKAGKDAPFLKNIDNILFRSFAGLEATKRLSYSYFLDFQSQITPTFTAEGGYQSAFFAPAKITTGPGMKYVWTQEKRKQDLLLNFSPAALQILVVSDQDLANAGAHGIDTTMRQTNGDVNMVNVGVGASLIATYKIELVKDVTFRTNLALTNNYLHEPQNIDVLWQNQLSARILKIFTIAITTDLRYDNDVPVPVDRDDNGSTTDAVDVPGPRVRFAQTFGIGVGFKF